MTDVTDVAADARERLRNARGFIFDMDGTLALGDRVNHGLRPLPGAISMLDWARSRGLPYVVFTNGTNRTPAHFARVLRDAGLDVPDQVIRYVLGTFGKPTAPVEPWVLDRVLDRPRAAELAAEPEPLDVAALRRRFGERISDEELLLRFGLPAEEVDAMIAAGPAVTHYNPDLVPVLKLLRELGGRPAPRELTVQKPGFRLSLRSNGR